MKVVDASVVVDLVAGSLELETLGDDEMAAPHLVDSEVIHALRGMVLRGRLSEREGVAAVDAFTRLTIMRLPADGLRLRMWDLGHNLSGYDATYVALAELTGSSLLTTDARLAHAPGVRCDIQLL